MDSLKKNRYLILMFCYLGYYVTTNLVFAGAFEVYFDDTLVFSKLEKMRYPTLDVCILSFPCCLGLETPLKRSFKEERSREEEEELISSCLFGTNTPKRFFPRFMKVLLRSPRLQIDRRRHGSRHQQIGH